MEIKEIANKEIWENFIRENSPQSLFQSWNWGDTITKIKNERSNIKNLWRLGIYDNNLVGIAQVVKTEAKRGIFLHIRHGPIFSKWNNHYLKFLLDYLNIFAKKEKAIFIRISPLIEDNSENRLLMKKYNFRDAPIHRLDGEVCWVLDINHEEMIFAGMRKTHRYLIKQAQKFGVKIIKTVKPDKLDEFVKLYDLTSKRQHFVKHKGIKEEFEIFSKDKQIILFE